MCDCVCGGAIIHAVERCVPNFLHRYCGQDCKLSLGVVGVFLNLWLFVCVYVRVCLCLCVFFCVCACHGMFVWCVRKGEGE